MTKSAFALHAQDLIDCGYSPIPILPGAKRPGRVLRGNWTGMSEWAQFCEHQPSSLEIEEWSEWPNAGLAIALGKASMGLMAIDIDTEEAAIRDAISGLYPDSPVAKVGQKGSTAFYQTDGSLPARKFRIGRVPVVELLGHGNQTVIPPTIHPGTGEPYAWVDGSTPIWDFAYDELPILTQDHVLAIEGALEPFGVITSKTTERQAGPTTQYAPGAIPASPDAMNDIALTRLDEWVPHLGFPFKRNPDGSYRMKALWRPSGSGKSIDKRGWSVNVHPRGIRDEAADEGHNAFSLIGCCMGLDNYGAWSWLNERLFPQITTATQEDIDATVRILTERQEAEKAQAIADTVNTQQPADPVSAFHEDQWHQDQVAYEEAVAEGAVVDVEEIPRELHDNEYTANIREAVNSCSGLLRELTNTLSTSSGLYSEMLGFPVALSLMAAYTGRHWVGFDGSRRTPTNIITLALADPGLGKSSAISLAKQICHLVKEAYTRRYPDFQYSTFGGDEDDKDRPLDPNIYLSNVFMNPGSSGIKSKQGLAKLTQQYPFCTIVQDEYGSFIERVFGRQKSALDMGLKQLILDAYSASSTAQDQAIQASKEDKGEVVIKPSLSFCAASAPGGFWPYLSDVAFRDGYMARHLLFEECVPVDKLQVCTPTPPSEELVSGFADLLYMRYINVQAAGNLVAAFNPGNTAPGQAPILQDVPMSNGAMEMAANIQRQMLSETAERNAHDDYVGAVGISRVRENAIKIATIHAVGVNYKSPIISEHDMQIGFDIAYNSALLSIQRGRENLTGQPGPFRNLVSLITEEVTRGGGVVSRTSLMSASHVPIGQFNAAIDWLCETGRLSPTITASNETGYILGSDDGTPSVTNEEKLVAFISRFPGGITKTNLRKGAHGIPRFVLGVTIDACVERKLIRSESRKPRGRGRPSVTLFPL